MNKKGLGQKIAFALAIVSYISAVLLAIYLSVYDQNRGTEDSIIASMMAGIVFFFGVGIVLHVIGKANLPDLRIRQGDSP